MHDPLKNLPGECMLNYRVSYPDTDAAGVVNHGRYIDMAERARHDLLRMAGFSYASLSTAHDTLLVVHKIKAIFHTSGILEDDLQLRTRISLCTPARTTWITTILRGQTLLATVEAELAALHASSKVVRRHPTALLDELLAFGDI